MVKIKGKKIKRGLKKSTRPKQLIKTGKGLITNPVKTITSPLGPKNEAIARAAIAVTAPVIEDVLNVQTGGEFGRRKAEFESKREQFKSGIEEIAAIQRRER